MNNLTKYNSIRTVNCKIRDGVKLMVFKKCEGDTVVCFQFAKHRLRFPHCYVQSCRLFHLQYLYCMSGK